MVTVDFITEAPTTGVLPGRWIHGSPSARRATDPALQVHHHDPHTVVLRQSMAVHHEAPFLYLIFGNDRALLLDTGAIADPARFPLRETVDALIDRWVSEHPRASGADYPLVVAHTHGHSDHVAGDPQFAGRPATTVVGTDVGSVRSFFRLPDQAGSGVPPREAGRRDEPGPAQPRDDPGPAGQGARFDLGGRVLEVTAIPGHEQSSIAVFDPWTGFLLTGDTVYRGRLYVQDITAFTASLQALVAIAGSRPVTHVMGCHIEMTRRSGRDYPIGARYQPDEPVLQMTTAQLTAVRDAAVAVAGRPGVHVFDDFRIFNGPCRRAMPGYRARALCHRARVVWSSVRNRLLASRSAGAEQL